MLSQLPAPPSLCCLSSMKLVSTAAVLARGEGRGLLFEAALNGMCSLVFMADL